MRVGSIDNKGEGGRAITVEWHGSCPQGALFEKEAVHVQATDARYPRTNWMH